MLYTSNETLCVCNLKASSAKFISVQEVNTVTYLGYKMYLEQHSCC